MKNFKEFAIPTVALFLICLVATTLLAVTNKVTAPKIAELSAQTEVETRQKVLPAATQFGETQEMKGGSGTYAVGKDTSGNEVGYVFVTVSKGYGGDVKIMTGVDKNGAVTGISPLELNETAGLGMKAQNASFLDQFKGTLYRQTMFAEFELQMGKMAESGEALTADALSAKYLALNKLYFGDDDLLVAEVIDNTTSRGRTLRFLFDGSYEEFKETLFKLGETPLPKWVREKVEPEDAERYQTIFASKEGAVAAPTAGMHFSKHLFKRMEIKGIEKAFITLHVGLGNFRTVDVEDLSKHKMDSEQFFVDEPTAEAVNKTKREGHKIVSIGTTVMRTLETAVSTGGMIKPMEGWTNKFIFAPYEFSVADAMVTNFQLPYSTQLMMVSAFGGYDLIMNAYKIAKEEGYRFGTYGDAMLIL